MYALIVPAAAPFVLLATLMGLSWWEDHVLPPAEHAEVPDGTPTTPATSAPFPQPARPQGSLTRDAAGS